MNILFIFTDQMHKYALGCINDEIHTPNLDHLAENGVLFTNTYSNCPICGPYRGNIFTGMYTSYNHVTHNCDPLPQNIKSMAEAFNNGGYNTSFVGKWHLGNHGNCPILKELRGGFKHFIGYQCYNGFYENVCFYNEDNEEIRFNKHRTDVTTDIAIERLKKLAVEDKPFIQVVAYQAPHYPVQPSEEYVKLYKDKFFSTSPDYKKIDPYTPTFSPYSPRPVVNCPDYQRYGNNMQEYLRLYYAMVSQIDNRVGRLVATLEELNILDETVIIFTSDHGDMQGSHGLKNKCVPYEKSCGIPLIVSVSNGRKGVVSNGLISSIDFYPSCLDYAGLPFEEHLQGKSFAAFTFGQKQTFNEPILAEFLCGENDDNWKMIRENKYKLVINWQSKEPELLFDMEEDPYELNNLVTDNKYNDIKNKLTTKILKI